MNTGVRATGESGARRDMTPAPSLGRALFDGRVRCLHFPAIASETGTLTPIGLTALPFRPVRSFFVNANDGAVRGGHGHRSGRQLLIRLSGQIGIELRWQARTETLLLDEGQNAVIISAPVWARQSYAGAPAIMIVFCEAAYDPDDYIDDGC